MDQDLASRSTSTETAVAFRSVSIGTAVSNLDRCLKLEVISKFPDSNVEMVFDVWMCTIDSKVGMVIGAWGGYSDSKDEMDFPIV